MRNLALVVVLAFGCGNKQDGGNGKPVEGAVTCKAGEVNDNGTCKAVLTAGQVAALGAQASRLDELGALLDKVNTIAAPVELAAAFGKLPEWKALVGKIDQLKIVDEVVAELDNAVKTLRTFRASLDQAETRLGNLKTEIEKLMTDTGATKKYEEVRANIGAQLRGVLEPLAQQVSDAIKNALQPLDAKLLQMEGLVEVGCGSLKVTGGSPESKQLCEQAKAAFSAGTAALNEIKDRPIKLYQDLSKQLVTELDALLDTASKTAIAAAQTEVDALLKLPPKQP